MRVRKIGLNNIVLMTLFILASFLLTCWTSFNLYRMKGSRSAAFFAASEEYVLARPVAKATLRRAEKDAVKNAAAVQAVAEKKEVAEPAASTQVLPIVPPRVISKTLPVYPESALKDGLEGAVKVRVLISENGSVSEVKLSRSSGWKALDDAAKASVWEWKFEPAKSGASAVSSWLEVPIKFIIK